MMKKKYPRPRGKKISLAKVRSFLEDKGYLVIDLNQPWRHVVGVVEREGQKYFFKLATTLKTGQYTQREVAFNDLLSKRLRENDIFRVPKNYESGYFEKKYFYAVREYFQGESLADKEKKRQQSTVILRLSEVEAEGSPAGRICSEFKKSGNGSDGKGLGGWLPKVAQVAFRISQIKCDQLVAVKKKKSKKIGEQLFESALEWANQLKVDLTDLIEVIRAAVDEVKTSLAHGDFTAKHLYDLGKGTLGLVDAELSGCQGARYYDVAQFYLRTRLEIDKKLAKKFLEEYRRLLSASDRKTFWQELKPVLAQRLIGEFWGRGDKGDLREVEQLKKELLEDKII